MQKRFHMNGLDGQTPVMVEHHYRETLESIRKSDTRFKRRRIQEVLQAYPSKIQVGVVYERGYNRNLDPVRL